MRHFSTSMRGHTERGFELVEVVLAAAILSLALLSVIGISGRSLLIAHQSLESYTASTLLQEGAEATRIIRDSGWSNIASLTPGVPYYPEYDDATDTWSLSTSPDTVGIFTRSIVMSDVDRDSSDDISSTGFDDPGTMLFTEAVTWQENDGSTMSKSLSFYLMNIM